MADIQAIDVMRWSASSSFDAVFYRPLFTSWISFGVFCVLLCQKSEVVFSSPMMQLGNTNIKPKLNNLASAVGRQKYAVCGPLSTDVHSSALLADVVLEGRVHRKLYPLCRGRPRLVKTAYYNISVRVGRHVWKGADLISIGGQIAKKLLIGTFALNSLVGLHHQVALSENVTTQGKLNASYLRRCHGNACVSDRTSDPCGAKASSEQFSTDIAASQCVGGDIAASSTYIFFLRNVGHNKYFSISALPVRKSRSAVKAVSRVCKVSQAFKPAVVVLTATKSVLTLGDTLILRCTTKSTPHAVYRWFRNGRLLSSLRGQRIKSNRRGSKLKLNRVTLKDTGVYTCSSANAIGQATESFLVNVTTHELVHKPCTKQTFCFNGGACRYVPSLDQTFCQCPEKFVGMRCEKKVRCTSTYHAGRKGSEIVIFRIFRRFSKATQADLEV